MNMTEEEYIRNRMDMIHRNSVYGLYAANSGEIAKIVRSYIGRDIGFDYDRLNCPKPPIYIGPLKVKTLKERLEDNTMKATSKQEIKNIRDISFSFLSCPIERKSELTITATTDDDIFEFVFEGEHIIDGCEKSGMFIGWETDQKIRELEKENKQNKEIADTWSKAYYDLSKKFDKLKEERIDEYEDKIEDLQHKYNLEKAANEAQRKFIKEYAGKGTEIEFNYAIGDDDEDTYVIVNKEEYKALKNIQNNVKDNDYTVLINGKIYNLVQLMDRIQELEALKTPAIENFADNVNHPSHYTGKYECIDVMQDVFGNEATDNFCLCNAFKYIWRARKKNGLEDVKKAVWYLNKYIEEAEKDGEDKVSGT